MFASTQKQAHIAVLYYLPENGKAEVARDIDLLSADVIKSYTASNPGTPTIFRRGETAHAEPAVPEWTVPVDELFE